jgi:hypothetical protein
MPPQYSETPRPHHTNNDRADSCHVQLPCAVVCGSVEVCGRCGRCVDGATAESEGGGSMQRGPWSAET